MFRINMLSKADMAQGHGVLSAQVEQIALVKETMGDICEVIENGKKSCEINHFHTINPEFFLSIPFRKKKGKCVGYVHFLPETVENSLQMPGVAKQVFYKYMLAFYKRMDYLVTVNPYFIEKLEHYGVDKDKIHYIPNYVSEEQFFPLDQSKKAKIRAHYQIPEDKFTVLCVGQLQKRKGVLEFINIAKRMPHVTFVWAGGFSFGKISDGYKEIKNAMEYAPDNLRFLGMIDRKYMNQVYNMADVMFLPSYEELFPMTILESMNCRIPILVRDLQIYEPILFDYAVRGKNQKDFMQIISRLESESAYYQECAVHAFEGHKYYSKENVAQMWRDYYRHIVCSK